MLAFASLGGLVAAPHAGAADPIQVSTINDGTFHTCAIRVSGQAVCWGRNEVGELGDGTEEKRLTPANVSGLTDAIAISVGEFHTCAIRKSGQAVCWGLNDYGALGDGTEEKRLTPVNVSGLTDAVAISAGQYGTCAIRESGQAVCWGSYLSGDGTQELRLTPTNVSGLTDAVAISSGNLHSCAIRTSGQAVCWGDNYYAQLGETYDWADVVEGMLRTGGAPLVASEAELVAAREGARDAGYRADATGSAGLAGVPQLARAGAFSERSAIAVLMTGVER